MFAKGGSGQLSREAFGEFVAAFSALGLAQVQKHIDLFHDVFGAAGGTHGVFGQAMWAATHKRADAHMQKLVARVFAAADGEALTPRPRPGWSYAFSIASH